MLARVRASSRHGHRRAPDCGLCVAVDVHYPSTGGPGRQPCGGGVAFAPVLAGRTAAVPRAAPCRPGEFSQRELPPLRAVLAGLSGLGLPMVDGHADLDSPEPARPRAHVHAESGIAVTGVATCRFRTATHAVPLVERGSSVRPLFVMAAGMPASGAADLFRRVARRYRRPDALRRAGALARAGPTAAIMTGGQPG